MTKSELVSRIQEKYPEMGNRLIENAVSLFFNEVISSLQKGYRIELRGFGSFCLRQRNKRVGRNPRTGETVAVEEKKVPFFKAGKAFRELLNAKTSLDSPSAKTKTKSRLSRGAPDLHSPQYGNHR